MAAENETRRDQSASHESVADHPDTLAISLTDLIDEMDRAAFLRSLAGRHLNRDLEIKATALSARPKRSRS